MKRFLYVLTCIALFVPSGIVFSGQAQAVQPSQTVPSPVETPSQSGDGTWYVVDLQDTPLTKGINEAYEKLPNKPGKGITTKNNKGLSQGGKSLGHVSQNITTLEYDNPKQKDPKGEKETWDPVKINMKPEKGKPEGWAEDAVLQPTGFDDMWSRGYGIFSTYNDDADCVDQVTGVHKGGIGNELECFVGAPINHVMAQNLIKVTIDGESYCQHPEIEGFIIPLNECEDRNHTTLMELIDEDEEEILDVDGDGDANNDSNGDGINDDKDCTDNNGNYYSDPSECYESDEVTPKEGMFPLIDEDLSVQIDNDKDGQTSEDPPGKKDDETLDEPGELCKAYYTSLGMEDEWDDGFYNDVTGECNVDAAIEKHVNKESNKKFGKNVFHEGEPGDKMNKWSEPFTQTEPSFEFTYPENLNPPKITLEVTNSENTTNKCNLNLTVLPQEEQRTDCNTPSGKPDANFKVSCNGRECSFFALANDAVAYEWNLGNLEKGNDRGAQSQNKTEAYVKGKESRTVTVTEALLVQCPPGYEYEEDPNSPLNAKKMRCKKAVPITNSLQEELQGLPALVSASTIPIGVTEYTANPEDTIHAYALMGFTFAPPVIQWGWKIEEEVCVFGFCFEIFYARIGYEFNMGVGLRLPVQVNITPIDPVNWPGNVWAEDSFSFDTSITPVDFSVEEFKEICEANNLADGFFIANCDRFSFPDFLNSQDGDEFVAYYKLFAGIIIRVLSIPIITWGVDSSFDLGQFCTMYNALNAVGIGTDGEYDKAEVLMNLATLLTDYVSGDDLNFYNFLKDQGILCGSFTTPYGYEDGELRTFPFLPPMGYSIPADCTKAIYEGQVITIKGKPRPICTNLILGTAGANLGLGLNFKVEAGSEVIGADWSAAGDAMPDPDNNGIANIGAQTNVRWEWTEDNTLDHSLPETIGPVIYDNYDLAWELEHDNGSLILDDFTYYLNLWLTVSASLEFGGILAPIPDIAEFKLFRISFGDITGLDGIPFPQHPGMDPIKISTPVKNYGADVLASPDQYEVPDVNDIFEGQFDVSITNIGSLQGSFDNIQAQVTNILQPPASTTPYSFDLIKDNDGDGIENEDPENSINDDKDCLDNTGTRQPATECLDTDGSLKDGWFWLIDEDPLDDAWRCTFGSAQSTPKTCASNLSLGPLGPYTSPQNPEGLTIQPLQHFTTRPGLYPVKVLADSIEAKLPSFTWNQFFPIYPTTGIEHKSGRWGAFDVTFIKVNIFFNPKANILPQEVTVTPRVNGSGVYEGTIQNAGNDPDLANADTIQVSTVMHNFNQAECTLTTLGKDPGCPYRAYPTIIQPGWVDDQLTIKDYGPLPSGGAAEAGPLEITVPDEWMGMQDTHYQFDILAYSTKGNITKSELYTFTVEATLESQTRYIIAEIDELIAEIEAANAQGIKTCGLYPVSLHPVSLQSQRALDLILAGKTNQALNALSANLHIMQGAFMHGVNCKSIPDDPWRNDWMQRGQAIIDDLILATTIP